MKPVLVRLLAAVACSMVLAIARYDTAHNIDHGYTFQIELASSTAGVAQVFFDQGRGFAESDSSLASVEPSAQLQKLKMALPAATLRALRFDPINAEGTIVFRNARIVSPTGKVACAFPPSEFVAQQQIASFDVAGDTVTLSTPKGGGDPILLLPFKKPLTFSIPFLALVAALLPSFFWSLALMAALLAGWHFLVASPRPASRVLVARWIQWMAAAPVRTLALAAVLAVLISSYPLIFCGRSMVSPNFGVVLLYEGSPTLPGMTSRVQEDVKGSDVGAIMWQHVPLASIMHQALLGHGELPFWNRFDSAGVPLLGQGQSMAADPLQIPVILADSAAWAWDLKYLAAKWLLSFGLGLIAWRLTRHLPSALAVALTSVFLGFFLFRCNHPAIFSFCYAPWILVCWVFFIQSGRPGADPRWLAGLLLACWAEMNSGTAKEAYMLLLCMNLAGAFLLLFTDLPWRQKLLRLAAAVGTGAVFVLVSAPVWLTFLDALRGSYTSYNVISAYQLQLGVVIGLFDELFYRPLQIHEWVFCPSANFLVLGGVLYFAAHLFRGALTRTSWALLLGSVLPFTLAFGIFPPEWIRGIPFLNNIAHLDNTFSCALIILLIVLAGCGFHLAFQRLSSDGATGDLRRMAFMLGILIVAYLSFGHAAHRQIYGEGCAATVWHNGETMKFDPFILISLFLLPVSICVLFWSAGCLLRAPSASPVPVLLIATCLVTMHWRQGLHLDLDTHAYSLSAPVRADFRAPSPAVETVRADVREPFRVAGIGNNLFPGWTGFYGIEGISGPDALMNPHFRELVLTSGVKCIWDWRIVVSAETLSETRRFFDFLNVRYYLDRAQAGSPLSPTLEPVVKADMDVYRSPAAWPRAFFTNRVTIYDQPREIAALIRNGDGRPFAAVQTPDRVPVAGLQGDHDSRKIVPAGAYHITANTTSFTVDATGPGIIVLQEAWLRKDFRAELNGRPVPYLRVNHAFKGIVVDRAGTYRVRFSFMPHRFDLALILCSIGVLAGAAGWFALCPPARWRKSTAA